MFSLRLIQPVLFALVLLLAQQGGVLHSVRHILVEQSQHQEQKTPHSNECEQCTSYSPLGSALNSSHFSFDLLASLTQERAQHHVAVHTQHTLTATARGPPALQSLT